MATWADAERVGLALPDVARARAHEGSPALEVHGRQLARRREDQGRAILQFWVRDVGVQEGLLQNEPDTFWVHHRFATPSVEAWLDRLDADGLREVLVESWWARATTTLRRQHPDL
ncbi:hypothetical protein ncot_05380 [Nocardioides sp. JQ2195]|uniref:hypothetical protein n=1 Tax=Nocardioides sp. JQ2195 TaxID=2592334 RepID=UPI00143E2AA1|nr:hypothetical protein [Nocardioides sp. JQ2195]QIX26092.1 hypothetical protein ncot_05380 [Nocardioides sp. JQ2195]